MAVPTGTDVHIDYALSDLSVAYLQEKPPISDQMFPRVTVDHQSNKYYLWDQGDFFRDGAALRAPGTRSAQIKLGLTNANYFADQYSAEYPIPDEIKGNQDAVIDLQQTGTRVITSQLNTRKDRAFAADFLKTSVWGTDITGVAAAPGASQTLQWNDATSDPASDMQTALEALLNAAGDIDGLRFKFLIGSAVRAALINHPDAIDRIKYVEKADVAAVDAIMAGWLGVDELIVGRRRYTTSVENQTNTFAAVVGKVGLLVAVPEAAGPNTPSAGYTFEWREPGKGPMYVETYRWEENKEDRIRGFTYFDQKAVATALGYYFTSIIG